MTVVSNTIAMHLLLFLSFTEDGQKVNLIYTNDEVSTIRESEYDTV